MSLSPRAIALQGIGYTPLLIALQGLWHTPPTPPPLSAGSSAALGGGPARRARRRRLQWPPDTAPAVRPVEDEEALLLGIV
jgi:hypothetical protein